MVETTLVIKIQQGIDKLLGFSSGSDDKESSHNVGNPGSIQCLGWEDPLEKRMATHSSVLAWRILWTEESGRLQSIWLQIVGHD